MRSSYKKIGSFVKQVNVRNKDLSVTNLQGININKFFMPSVANTNGTDLSKYKVVAQKQFAFNPMHVGRDEVLPISMLEAEDSVIVSPAYVVFKVKNETQLLPEYLMMWCRRPEFDRNAWFTTDSSVRGGFSWKDFCDLTLPVPTIEKQREIVREYHTIVDRIKLNEQLNQKLEETAHALFKKYFIDDEDSEHEEVDLYVEYNPKHTIKKGKMVSYVEMADLQETSLSIKNVIQREFTAGSKFKNEDTLLARITPCLENGKTAFVNCLSDKEIAYGSTEFIVMRAKHGVSPYWVYCLAKDENFRSYAISSMVGSSGRQRVHSDYLKLFTVPKITEDQMVEFHDKASVLFNKVKQVSEETKLLLSFLDVLLSKLTKAEATV